MGVFWEYQTVAHEMVNKYGIIVGKQVEDRVYKVANMVKKPTVADASFRFRMRVATEEFSLRMP